MKQTDFLERLSVLYETCVVISRKKNADYASDSDAFLNFRNSATLSGVSVEDGIMVRMGDKFARVRNLLTRDAMVTDETMLDTLSDLANYAMILRIWLEEKARLKSEARETAMEA